MTTEISSASHVPLIDEAKLDAIKELAEPGDADGFFRDLIELFFTRAPILIGEMDDALQRGDSGGLARSAHTLKGTSGNLGAARMMKLAESLETCGKSSELSAAPQLVTAIRSAFDLSKSELEKHLIINF